MSVKVPFRYKVPTCFATGITPFTDDDRVDEDRLRRHLRWLAAAGVGVYVAGGGSGEAYTLSRDEMRRVLEVAAETLSGVVPVRGMGVEPNSARQMIDFVRMVEASGCDAAQIYSLVQGHGLRPSDEEIEQYYVDILSETDFPVVLSSHQLAGYVLALPLIESLLDRFPQIIGLVVSQPDIVYLVRLMDLVAGRVEVHVGGIQQTLAHLALGGHGYLSSQANLMPRLSQSVIEAFVAGDLSRMNEAFTRVLRLLAWDQRFGNVRGIKAALNLLGLHGGAVRRPRLPVATDAIRALVEQMIDELEVRRIERVPMASTAEAP